MYSQHLRCLAANKTMAELWPNYGRTMAELRSLALSGACEVHEQQSDSQAQTYRGIKSQSRALRWFLAAKPGRRLCIS